MGTYKIHAIETCLEKDLWDAVKTWESLLDADSKIVEAVLRRMAEKARQQRGLRHDTRKIRSNSQ